MTVSERTFAPGGAVRCQDAIKAAKMSDPLTLAEDADVPGGWVIRSADGAAVGYLTSRHAIARELSDGRAILHLSVNGVPGPAASQPVGLTVRIATGDAGDTFEMPPVLTKSYPTSIVGESNYQEAIRSVAVGDPVSILHETGNPFDADALVVKTKRGSTIGYIGRSNWLRDAVIDEGKGCNATIASVARSESGDLGVVLDLTLTSEEIGSVAYARAPSKPVAVANTASTVVTPAEAARVEPRRSGWIARLFGMRSN